MLGIRDVEIISKEELNHSKRTYKKRQILLYDTKRRVDDFVKKIKYRRNGKYDDIPHFIVTKTGDIYKVLDVKYSSKTFDIDKVDRQQIKIAVENLGWLNKNSITGFFSNWIGDPYRTEPFIRSWREKFYWDKYNSVQMKSLVSLCDHLCDEYMIKKQVVPTNGIIENIEKLGGIVCKSNFSNIYTDINPSFNFKMFVENEI
jgi:N-acetyl-anhydromuramyl-L-alanine amidase AmpD